LRRVLGLLPLGRRRGALLLSRVLLWLPLGHGPLLRGDWPGWCAAESCCRGGRAVRDAS
jgi:hypothetical protein